MDSNFISDDNLSQLDLDISEDPSIVKNYQNNNNIFDDQSIITPDISEDKSTIKICGDRFKFQHKIIHEKVPSTKLEQDIVDEISLITNRIKSRRFNGVGNLGTYSKLLKDLESTQSHYQKNIELNLEPLDKYAISAVKLTNILDNMSLRYQNLVSINSYDTLDKIKNNLLKIELLSIAAENFKSTVSNPTTLPWFQKYQRTLDSVKDAVLYANTSIGEVYQMLGDNLNVDSIDDIKELIHNRPKELPLSIHDGINQLEEISEETTKYIDIPQENNNQNDSEDFPQQNNSSKPSENIDGIIITIIILSIIVLILIGIVVLNRRVIFNRLIVFY